MHENELSMPGHNGLQIEFCLDSLSFESNANENTETALDIISSNAPDVHTE